MRMTLSVAVDRAKWSWSSSTNNAVVQ